MNQRSPGRTHAMLCGDPHRAPVCPTRQPEPLCARLVSLAPCAKPSTHCDCLWQASAALSGTKESTLYLTSSKVGRTTDDFLRSTRYLNTPCSDGLAPDQSIGDSYNRCDRWYPRRTPMETPGTDWATSTVTVPAAHLCLVHKN